MPTSTDPRPCRIKFRGGTTMYLEAHHRDVQRALRVAERAGAPTVTVAGAVLPIADISIVLPYRKRRRDPLAHPYQKENQP